MEMASVSPLARTTCAAVDQTSNLFPHDSTCGTACSLKSSTDTTFSDHENVFFEGNDKPLCILTEWKSNSVNTGNTTTTTTTDNASQFCDLFKGREMCSDSKRLLCTTNAGGNSIFSEVLSFEFIKEFFAASNITVSLYKTEMELTYAEGSKITDFALKLENAKKESVFIGCSVTRCFNFLDLNATVSKSSIKHLLKKKLEGVISSTNGVLNCPMKKQILHVWTTNSDTAELIKEVFENDISDDVKSNTIVLVTVAGSGFECLFRERGDDVSRAISMLGLSSMNGSSSTDPSSLANVENSSDE